MPDEQASSSSPHVSARAREQPRPERVEILVQNLLEGVPELVLCQAHQPPLLVQVFRLYRQLGDAGDHALVYDLPVLVVDSLDDQASLVDAAQGSGSTFVGNVRGPSCLLLAQPLDQFAFPASLSNVLYGYPKRLLGDLGPGRASISLKLEPEPLQLCADLFRKVERDPHPLWMLLPGDSAFARGRFLVGTAQPARLRKSSSPARDSGSLTQDGSHEIFGHPSPVVHTCAHAPFASRCAKRA